MGRATVIITAVFTVIAVIIAVGGLILAFNTADKLSETSNSIESVTQSVERINKTIERIDEQAYIQGKLSSRWWPDYVSEAQRTAFYSSPQYVRRLPDGTYELTHEGEAVLGPRFVDAIIDTVKENKEIPLNEALLKLDVRDLSLVAYDRGVPPNVIIGIAGTYVQQVKNQT